MFGRCYNSCGGFGWGPQPHGHQEHKACIRDCQAAANLLLRPHLSSLPLSPAVVVFGEEPPAVAWPGDGPGPGEEEQKERGLKTLLPDVCAAPVLSWGV